MYILYYTMNIINIPSSTKGSQLKSCLLPMSVVVKSGITTWMLWDDIAWEFKVWYLHYGMLMSIISSQTLGNTLPQIAWSVFLQRNIMIQYAKYLIWNNTDYFIVSIFWFLLQAFERLSERKWVSRFLTIF